MIKKTIRYEEDSTIINYKYDELQDVYDDVHNQNLKYDEMEIEKEKDSIDGEIYETICYYYKGKLIYWE